MHQIVFLVLVWKTNTPFSEPLALQVMVMIWFS